MRTSSVQKQRTSSFQNAGESSLKNSYVSKVGYSPGKSAEDRFDRSPNIYDVRFRRKDLKEFNPINYRSASLTEQDVLDLK
jgi:hypothetical protein